jgi:ribosomal protein S18 acetylase RimI-like enzyme
MDRTGYTAGPLSFDEFSLPEDLGPPVLAPHKEEKWKLLSPYTLSNHRGYGLGQKLRKEAFAFVVSLYRLNVYYATTRIMAKLENTITVGLYKPLGFARSGRCTLAETLKVNGDVDLLP